VAHQRVQVSLAHACKLVTVEVHDNVLRVVDDDTGEILKVVPRTSMKEVTPHKAHPRDHRLKARECTGSCAVVLHRIIWH
jgi:hypothetical protein